MPPSGLVRCKSWVGITEQEFMKCERLLVVWLVALVPSQCQNVLKTDGRALLPRRLAGRPDVCNPAVHHRAFRPPPRVQCADGLGRELLRRVSKASSSSTTYTTLGSTRPLASPSQRSCAQHYLTAALRRYPGAGLDDWQQSWPSGARG
ncbi:amino acid permease [Metarhizium robertsii ARSEF 23]|uniref:Amino acid permease n=1 Tax=Metarhizium robertsii (strain ARSEF 23 / ATCC MYA-3075) TaxID=655844 RepID=E9EK70_METRA|nr:amino acid permease [Metarhizium robertsii ARSEF 23]EFZ03410.2 amino acid permease [Metarhizium robertsii ARSEF 23]